MKDYKRLTNNNLEEYNPEYDFCMGCKYFGEPNGCNRPNGTCGNYERFIETYDRLAELEDKIEQGKMIELPCKVGDTVYFIDEKKWCWEMVVAEIAILKKHIVYKIGNSRKELRYVYDEDLGKKWFLTKAEAEQKLESMSND